MANPNPDELMKMVEAELRLMKPKRGSSSSRNAFRIWSLVIIVGGVIVGLLLLKVLASQIPRPHNTSNATPAATGQDAPPR